jgi:hypothetical protein
MKAGDKVHYTAPHGAKENGKIKSIGDDYAFVVFHCNNEWDKYEDYTGQKTELSQLKAGWFGEKTECDHHYIPTNAKWQSINQRECVHCGHIID